MVEHPYKLFSRTRTEGQHRTEFENVNRKDCKRDETEVELGTMKESIIHSEKYKITVSVTFQPTGFSPTVFNQPSFSCKEILATSVSHSTNGLLSFYSGKTLVYALRCSDLISVELIP